MTTDARADVDDAAVPTPAPAPAAGRGRTGGSAAVLVAAGILLSRVLGLVRQRVFAHYFGALSDAADAFTGAFRIPNLLQNLFGEGVLSASFVPVYARLLADGKDEERNRLAGAVLALLALTVSIVVLLGVLAAPLLTTVVVGGFHGEKRELSIRLVRILFPGAGLLAMSAWCLGVLNSHRKFFLSYAAPVLWNVAMIATLLIFGPRMHGDAGGSFAAEARLAVWLAWGSVVGSALQVLVQLPSVLELVRGMRPRLDLGYGHLRTVVRNFVPAFVGRGVVQISAFVDMVLASPLGTGAVNSMNFAQTLYLLPVSLFGMSISVTELTEMSRESGGAEAEVAERLRRRLDAGLRRIAFFVVPCAVAFLAIGDVITALLFQTGKFGREGSVYVWGILAGSAVGLLASTLGRLYSSTYYALHDTRTPLRFAVVRVALTIGLGYLAAQPLPRALGIDIAWGAAGLTASAGVAGWVEFVLLRSRLNQRIGRTGLPASYTVRLYLASALAAGAAWLVKWLVGMDRPILDGLPIVAAYGLTYLALTMLLVKESRQLLRRR